MNTTFLRSLSIGALLTSISAFAANAAKAANDDLTTRVTTLETQMNQISTQTAIGTFGAKGASGYAPLHDDYGVSLNVDVLYWHVYEGGTYNFTRNFQGASESVGKAALAGGLAAYEFDTDAHNAHFDWDFGFKAGIRRRVPHDSWDFGGEFTYFRTKGRDVRGDVFPIETIAQNLISNRAFDANVLQTTTGAILSASTKWKIRFYDLIVDLGRSYFFSHDLALKPTIGLKTSWIQQHASSMRNSAIAPASSSTAAGGITGLQTLENSKRKNNFWGIGPKIGIDTKWYIVSSFSLYGSVEAALLWGKFSIEVDETVLNTTSQLLAASRGFLFSNTTETHSNPRRLVPNTTFDLGICWDFVFNKNKNNLEFKLGYENQYWWRQNYITDGTLNSADDLGFHGGLFEVKFDF